MANPLTMLKLKPAGVQMIHELPIAAPPGKVWESLLNVGGWFIYDAGKAAKQSLDVRPGGRWISENADGSAVQMAMVTHIEPGKLLRLSGQMGMTHVPVVVVVIFEVQPGAGGSGTLLRVGTRMHGLMLSGVKKMYREGWNHYLPQLKALAEG